MSQYQNLLLFSSTNSKATLPLSSTSSSGAGAATSIWDSGLVWITYYFLANLSLTIHNKWVLKELHFDFPWLLTGIHIGISGLGAYAMIYGAEACKPARLFKNDRLMLLAFSFLYTINIAISNVSLNFVSLAFHQIVRSSTPVFTILMERLSCLVAKPKSHALSVYLSLLPVVGGVVISTMGEYSGSAGASEFTWVSGGLGVFLTVLGVFLSALKTIGTNALMVGSLKLHPLDLLHRLAPLAFLQCLLYAYFFGEIEGVYLFFFFSNDSGDRLHGPQTDHERYVLAGKLLLNGLLAFFLNYVSFTANKKTSALTMTVAGNVKQAMSIILAIYVFNTAVTSLKAIGILVTLTGGSLYSYYSYLEKVKPPPTPATDSSSPMSEILINRKDSIAHEDLSTDRKVLFSSKANDDEEDEAKEDETLIVNIRSTSN